MLEKLPDCHPEESRSDRDDEGSPQLLDFTTAEILLRRLTDQNDITLEFFGNLLGRHMPGYSPALHEPKERI